MEQFNLMFECEDCKEKFPINKNDGTNLVHKKEFFDKSGKSIFLTYYDCPSCGRRHFVQIDDKASLRELNDVSKMFVSLSIAKRKGKEISQKQSAKFKKARQHLSVYRMKLMEEYTGKLIRNNETESYFKLEFSVW